MTTPDQQRPAVERLIEACDKLTSWLPDCGLISLHTVDLHEIRTLAQAARRELAMERTSAESVVEMEDKR